MKNIIKIMLWALVWFLLVIWSFSAYSAWTSTDTEWTESSFENGQPITNNMISALTLGYVKDSSWNKIYWKNIPYWHQLDWHYSNSICLLRWMTLPTNTTRDLMFRNNYLWIDSDGSVKNWNSQSTRWTRHWWRNTSSVSQWTSQKWFLRYLPMYPSYANRSHTNNWYFTDDRALSTTNIICVYKN